MADERIIPVGNCIRAIEDILGNGAMLSPSTRAIFEATKKHLADYMEVKSGEHKDGAE